MPLLLTSAHIHTLQATQLNFFVDHQKKELVRPVLLDKLVCITMRLVYLLVNNLIKNNTTSYKKHI